MGAGDTSPRIYGTLDKDPRANRPAAARSARMDPRLQRTLVLELFPGTSWLVPKTGELREIVLLML